MIHRQQRKRKKHPRGAVLGIALAAIAILSLAILAMIASIQGPTRLLGRQGKAQSELVKAESKLEHARALLMQNPDADISSTDVTATWTDTCTMSITAKAGDLTITETWIVSAPTRFLVYADSTLTRSDSTTLDGRIHTRSPNDQCDTFTIDTEALSTIPTRRITADEIDGLVIQNEAVEIYPAAPAPPDNDSQAITLRNVTIDRGLLIIHGNARFGKSLRATSRPGWPIIIVEGDIQSEAHEDPWSLDGVVAVTHAAFLAGPLTFEGTIAARSVEFFSTGTGIRSATDRYHPVIGLMPTISRRERGEYR